MVRWRWINRFAVLAGACTDGRGPQPVSVLACMSCLLNIATGDGDRARERGFVALLAANVGFVRRRVVLRMAHAALVGGLFCGAAMAPLLSAGLFVSALHLRSQSTH